MWYSVSKDLERSTSDTACWQKPACTDIKKKQKKKKKKQPRNKSKQITKMAKIGINQDIWVLIVTVSLKISFPPRPLAVQNHPEKNTLTDVEIIIARWKE